MFGVFKKIGAFFAFLLAMALSAIAQTAPSVADVSAELTAIETMWGVVAALVIGVAAVFVALRFLKRAAR